jgi:hypothetical protein
MIDPVDISDATLPVLNLDTDFNPASALDDPSQSSLGDSMLSCSTKERRSRGRPRRQIPAVETHPLQIEPKRKLRSQRLAGAEGDDPWVVLSNAPLITPVSPKKALKNARPSTQKPVNDPLSCPYKCLFPNNISTR